jgi:hypothetical protein
LVLEEPAEKVVPSIVIIYGAVPAPVVTVTVTLPVAELVHDVPEELEAVNG